MSLTQIHGAAVLVWMPVIGNFLLATWAGITWLRGRRVLPPVFWPLLLLVLAPLAVQAVAGLLLLSSVRPRTGLHLLYAVLVVFTAIAQYGLRPGGAVRRAVAAAPDALPEAQVLALLCLTQAGLIMRAWMTGLFGR